MNQAPPFQLSKIRSISTILSESFAFLGMHKKKLAAPLLLATLPIALLATLPTVEYFKTTLDLERHQFYSSHLSNTDDFLRIIYTVLPMLIGQWLASLAVLAILASYIDLLQIDPHSFPETSALYRKFGGFFVKTTLISIPVFIVTGLGFCLCIAPGIWLSIILWIFYPLYLLEKVSVNESFRRTLGLMKGSFWDTFGLLLLSGLIVGVISSIASYLSFIPNLMEHFQGKSPVTTTLSIVLTFLSLFVRFGTQIVLSMCAILQYGNLKEQKEGTTLSNKIESLGLAPQVFDFQKRKEEY